MGPCFHRNDNVGRVVNAGLTVTATRSTCEIHGSYIPLPPPVRQSAPGRACHPARPRAGRSSRKSSTRQFPISHHPPAGAPRTPAQSGASLCHAMLIRRIDPAACAFGPEVAGVQPLAAHRACLHVTRRSGPAPTPPTAGPRHQLPPPPYVTIGCTKIPRAASHANYLKTASPAPTAR